MTKDEVREKIARIIGHAKVAEVTGHSINEMVFADQIIAIKELAVVNRDDKAFTVICPKCDIEFDVQEAWLEEDNFVKEIK